MLLLARVGGLLRPRAFNWPQDSVEICSENLGLWDLCELVPTDNDNTPEFAFAAKTFSTPKVLPNYSTLDTTFFGHASGAEFSWSIFRSLSPRLPSSNATHAGHRTAEVLQSINMKECAPKLLDSKPRTQSLKPPAPSFLLQPCDLNRSMQ